MTRNTSQSKPLIRATRLAAFLLAGVGAFATPWDPQANDFAGRKGTTLYVSKLGDNTDGTSWPTAFTTVQAALDAIPDAEGGHVVVLRPDTYVEANLWPKHKGAQGAYNVLAADSDGSLGSGAQGYAIIDAGCPDIVVRQDHSVAGGNPPFKILTEGGPEKGLKSVDWWGPYRCDPNFSGVVWDRWVFRGLYSTGSEGGMGWDMTCEAGTPFTAVAEDCVGIGRFAGACVMGHTNRPDEPVVFRRSYFMCLDVWGDAGAAYVRAHNPSMPESYDAIFEDCVLVGTDNALQVGYPKFEGYSRVKFLRSKLIVLNFSQPHGTPATGIVYSDLLGKFLHVDLEDCFCMGYKVFGARDNDMFSFSLKGTNRAYVQFQQETPEGFERLALFPAEEFRGIAPPQPGVAIGK
ncbi:MAG: hypothetical protein IT365_06525 [Candidatus Hydrogenedentes bacterium]|nr:hypothetical protein [Candidatus Hydrogenedentota bacterium]